MDLRVVFMGTPEFARVSLSRLIEAGMRPVCVFTQPDRPAGRRRVETPPAVKAEALRAGIPVRQPATLKDTEIQRALAATSPDVIAVVAYGKILPQAVLDIPRLGCVNVHASVLPRHRGASPIAHAIWAGDADVGVTTMRMEAGLDTGPMYLKRAIPMPPAATTASLTPVLAGMGADLLVETLSKLVTGSLVPIPQDDALASMAPRLKTVDGRLDFCQEAMRLERQVRAFDPWPGTWIEVAGERIKVLSVAVGLARFSGKPPGTLLPGPPLGVVCGDGLPLFLTRLQREGKRPLPAEEVLRGFKIPEGTRL
jgi:methionyl-tRNA formyltransferase